MNKIFVFKLLSILLFTGAAGIASTPYAYVANISGNNVSVVNPATNSVVASIPVPSSPSGIAVTPDGSTVYVVSQSANCVSAISTASNSIVATVPVGATPVRIAISPNGALAYVVNQAANSVSVISTSTNSVVATTAVGSHPLGIALSPDGSYAYVANVYGNNISVISTATDSVISSYATGSGPSSIVVSPGGNYLYVTNQNAGTITVHSPANGSIVGTISGFLYPNSLALTPDGSALFVTNGNGASVSILNTSTNAIATTVATGSLPTSVAISTDGSEAYVVNEYAFSLSRISTTTFALMGAVPRVGVYPVSVATAPGVASPVCTYSISPGGASFGSDGGTGSLSVTAPSGCDWSAGSNVNWARITAGAGGSGNESVSYMVNPNGTTSTLNGTLTIAGQSFAITEQGSSFAAIRVHCGGNAYTDPAGNLWAADHSGNIASTTMSIGGTTAQGLYKTEKWSTGTLQYGYSVPNGSYTVRLKFAEFYLSQRGQRQMNLAINGVTLLGAFDILANTSPNTAYDLTFPVVVSNGRITIQLVAVVGTAKLNGLEITAP